MNPGKRNISVVLVIYLAFFVVSCQRATLPSAAIPTNTAESVVDQGVDEEQDQTLEESATITVQSESQEDTGTGNGESDLEPTPSYTATPDVRPLPEQWQQWPVVPEISPNTVSIYKRGIAQGNNPTRFSKIGDCQSIKEVLLGIYDLPTRYTLATENQYLQASIDQYSGSFNRDGMAVRGGFNAATVLSPIWSDPEFCDPGENPIQCEYRVHQPTLAIISLEVWWDGRSPERYEQYMRKIIEYSIEQGVVPVLSTKADNVEGDHSINYTTAKLAYEYDIPLWNFWGAVQALPNQGIDPDRDGFHISVAAWNVRSFTALQTIYAIGQAAENSDASLVLEDVGSDENTDLSTSSELVYDANGLETSGQSGTLYFEMTETIDGVIKPAGIYALDFGEGQLQRLYSGGSHIVSKNPAFGFIVAGEDGGYEYIRLDGSSQPIFDYPTLEDGDVFLTGENELLLTEVSAEKGVALYYGTIDDDHLKVSQFTTPGIDGKLSGVYAATNDILVISVGDCSQSSCNMYSVQNYRNPDEANVIEMVYFDKPSIQTETGLMAFWRKINGVDSLNLIDLSHRGNEQYLGLFGNVFLDQAWKNDSNLIAAIKMERSNYFGRATQILHYVVDGDTNIIKEYTSVTGLNPLVAWAPEGDSLLTSVTQVDDAGNSTIVLRILNTLTGQEAYLESDLGLTSETYIAITELVWLD